MEREISDKKIFFLSDVHLSFNDNEVESEKREKLYTFLEHVRTNGDVLIIAGDLFDFWYEWRHVVPKYWFGVIQKIRTLIKTDFIRAFKK